MDLHTWILSDYVTLDFIYAEQAGRVPRARWAERPFPSANPISFEVWHLSRWEDVIVNLALLSRPTVYDEGWSAKLGVGSCPGTGWTPAEVDAFAAAVSPDALDGYWHEVRSRTLAWLESISETDLEKLFELQIDMDTLYAREPDLAPEAIEPVLTDVLAKRRGHEHVRWGLIGHSYMHLGALDTVASALGSSH